MSKLHTASTIHTLSQMSGFNFYHS